MDDDNFEDSLLSTVKLRFYVNGSMKNGKDIMVSRTATFEEILHLVGNKLGIRAKRLFTSEGMEIDDTSLLDNGDIVFVSTGNGYVVPSSETSSSSTKHRRNNNNDNPLSPLESNNNTPSSSNEIIGNYRTVKLIGRGGFGEVRLAIHSITHEYAAIKFLPLGEAMSATDAERVTTEISCLSELDHIHVIKLLQVINTNNFVAIILEYAPGGELKQYVDTTGRKRLLHTVQQYLQNASVAFNIALDANNNQHTILSLLLSSNLLGVPKSSIDYLGTYSSTIGTESCLPLSVAISNYLSPPSTIASISPYLHFKPTGTAANMSQHEDNGGTRSHHRIKSTNIHDSPSSDSTSPVGTNSSGTSNHSTPHTPAGLMEDIWNSGLDEDEACIKFLQIARGVAYAHSKRIIHRDLKLENVLLGTQNNLKIADFGLSQYSSNNDNSNTGASGSLYYMAPETLLAKPPAPSASLDIWSLGVVLYTLLTGRLPFVSLSVLKAEHQLRLEAIMQYIIMPILSNPTNTMGSNPTNNTSLTSEIVPSAFKKPPKSLNPSSQQPINVPNTNSNRPQRRSITHISDNPNSGTGTVPSTNDNTTFVPSRPASPSSQSHTRSNNNRPTEGTNGSTTENNGINMHDMVSISRPESVSASDDETWENFSPNPATTNNPHHHHPSSSVDTLLSKPVVGSTDTITVNPSNDSVVSASSSLAGGGISSPTNVSSFGTSNGNTSNYLAYFQRDYFTEAEKSVETLTILKETRNAITNAKFYIPKRLSTQVVALLKSMLNPDPSQRPMVSEVLVHPWLLTNSSSRITGMHSLDSIGSFNEIEENDGTTPDIDVPGVLSPSTYNGMKQSSSSLDLQANSTTGDPSSSNAKGNSNPGFSPQSNPTVITNSHTVGSRIIISPINKTNLLSSTAPKLVNSATKDSNHSHGNNTSSSVYESYRDDSKNSLLLNTNSNVHLAGSGASALLQKSRSTRNRVNIGALGSPSTITSPTANNVSSQPTNANSTSNSNSLSVSSPYAFNTKPPLFSSPSSASSSSRSLTSPSHGINSFRPSINIGTVITSSTTGNSDSSSLPSINPLSVDSIESPLPPLRGLPHNHNEPYNHHAETGINIGTHDNHPDTNNINGYGGGGYRSKRSSLVESSTFTIGMVVPARDQENITVPHSSPVETVAAAQAMLTATGIVDDNDDLTRNNDSTIIPNSTHPHPQHQAHHHDSGIHVANQASFIASLMTSPSHNTVPPIHIPGNISRPRTPVHLQPLDIGSIIQPSHHQLSHHQ